EEQLVVLERPRGGLGRVVREVHRGAVAPAAGRATRRADRGAGDERRRAGVVQAGQAGVARSRCDGRGRRGRGIGVRGGGGVRGGRGVGGGGGGAARRR